MLRITQKSSAGDTVRYFFGYYSEHELGAPEWLGKGSELIGLNGLIQEQDFASLCNNQHPITGEQITGRMASNRTIAYDMTFSIPKSISIVHAITNDEDILNGFNVAVKKAMEEMERSSQVRVRVDGANEDRTVGNMIYGVFTHGESRPVDGISDPQLHKHVIVPNLIYDDKEDKWKAGQFRNIKANAPYYETLFRSVFADELTKSGYAIERSKNDFELKGFGRNLIEKFSRRTGLIEEKANELGLTYSEDKALLGAKTRAEKLVQTDRQEMQKEWQSRLTNTEAELIDSAKGTADNNDNQHDVLTPNQTLDYALAHLLQRKSVVTEKELIMCGLKRSFGSVTPETFKEAIGERKDLLSRKEKDGDTLYTTHEALNEEKQLINSSLKGLGTFKPINKGYVIKNDELTDEQAQAVHHALGSKDFITAISGKAGVGKTYCIKEVANGVVESGMSFTAVAPSAEASRGVQRKEGFKNATTVADLLQNDKLQDSIKDGVLWVDEASLLGNNSMNEIISLASKQNARLLLSGDRFQHNSPERGDAYRILQEYGGIKPARINKIQRQKMDEYRKAVKLISNDEISKGLENLDDMGAIKESEDFDSLLDNVASDYVESVKRKEQTLVVSTTHNQGKAITGKIREQLKAEGLIGKRESSFDVQTNLNYTDAEKSDPLNYSEGQIIQFHQNMKGGINRGSKFRIMGKDEDGAVEMLPLNSEKKEDSSIPLPLEYGSRFSVYEQNSINIAKGDLLRITQNGYSLDKKRLNNGNILSVKGFDKEGNILTSTGKRDLVIGKDFGNLNLGYYSTSPASQGKSVNRVIIIQSSLSGKAASKEQFYVSASRGKFSISIHTDDKQHLFKAVQQSSKRMSAIELAISSEQEIHSKKKHLNKSIQSGVERLKKMNQLNKINNKPNKSNHHGKSGIK